MLLTCPLTNYNIKPKKFKMNPIVCPTPAIQNIFITCPTGPTIQSIHITCPTGPTMKINI